MAQSYNPNNNPMGSNQYNGDGQNRSVFSRILRDLSTWGMSYDDMIIKNRQLISVNEDPNAIKGSMYDFFSQRAVASLLNKKMIPYLRVGYAEKVKILREYSVKDEIRDYIVTMADESII